VHSQSQLAVLKVLSIYFIVIHIFQFVLTLNIRHPLTCPRSRNQTTGNEPTTDGHIYVDEATLNQLAPIPEIISCRQTPINLSWKHRLMRSPPMVTFIMSMNQPSTSLPPCHRQRAINLSSKQRPMRPPPMVRFMSMKRPLTR